MRALLSSGVSTPEDPKTPFLAVCLAAEASFVATL
jgi:hypothetical protein